MGWSEIYLNTFNSCVFCSLAHSLTSHLWLCVLVIIVFYVPRGNSLSTRPVGEQLVFNRLIPFLISTKHGVPKTTLALALCFNRIVCVFFPSDFSKPIFSLGREGDGKGSDSTVINLDRSPSSGCRTLFLIFRHRVSPFARARPAAWYVPCLPIVGVRSLSLAHGSVGRPAATRLVLPRHCSRPQHSLMLTLVLPQPSLFLLVYLMIPILSCQYLFFFKLSITPLATW